MNTEQPERRKSTGRRDTDHPPLSANRLLNLIILLIVCGGIGIGVLALGATHQADRIAGIEKQDIRASQAREIALIAANAELDKAIVLIRQTDYRLCVRSVLDRATLNVHIEADRAARVEHGRAPLQALYDCTPDLTGGAAKLLNRHDKKALEDYAADQPDYAAP